MQKEAHISSFGYFKPGHWLRLSLSALAALKETHSFHYHLTGDSDDWPIIRELLRLYGLVQHVTIQENSSPAFIEQQLAHTDLALCLHECKIDESAAYLHQVMAAGVPALVFRTASFEALPEDAVIKVDMDEYAEPLLRAYLERLIEDASLRQRIGEKARLYAQSHRMKESANSQMARPVSGRFSKIAGLDYKQGAIEYPAKLDASNRHHLLTKPFYNLAHKISKWEGEGLDEDTRRHFCDFANMAVTLALPPAARILDVGCGSGWLCEYFARFGYDVTGIDISPDLINMAQERLSRVPYQVDQETPLRYHFMAHDIERAPLDETFDAIICYDALHHFEDEEAVCRHLSAMLDYGGLLFVLEGERPPAGSAQEEELREVMQQYRTLESPFSRDYLRSLLAAHGFAMIGDYVSVYGLFERDLLDRQGRLALEPPPVNYLLCKKISSQGGPSEMFDSRQPNQLRARLTPLSEWTGRITPDELLQLTFAVENTGDTLWLVSRAALKGTVRIGMKILDEEGAIVDEVHGVPPLPHALAPGESATLTLKHQAPARPGAYILKLDLVDQEICWFEQQGSEPLMLPFVVD